MATSIQKERPSLNSEHDEGKGSSATRQRQSEVPRIIQDETEFQQRPLSGSVAMGDQEINRINRSLIKTFGVPDCLISQGISKGVEMPDGSIELSVLSSIFSDLNLSGAKKGAALDTLNQQVLEKKFVDVLQMWSDLTISLLKAQQLKRDSKTNILSLALQTSRAVGNIINLHRTIYEFHRSLPVRRTTGTIKSFDLRFEALLSQSIPAASGAASNARIPSSSNVNINSSSNSNGNNEQPNNLVFYEGLVKNYLQKLEPVAMGWLHTLKVAYADTLDISKLMLNTQKLLGVLQNLDIVKSQSNSSNSAATLAQLNVGTPPATSSRASQAKKESITEQSNSTIQTQKPETTPTKTSSSSSTVKKEESGDSTVIVYTPDKKVKGATLQVLVDLLFDPNNSDQTYFSSFLYSFTTFTSASDIVTQITSRYPNEYLDNNTFIGKRFAQFLKSVLDIYGCELVDDKRFSMTLHLTFPKHSRNTSDLFQQVQQYIKSATAPKVDHGLSWYQFSNDSKQSSASISNSPGNLFVFNQFKPVPLAHQMTLMDFTEYKSIGSIEYLDTCYFNEEGKSEKRLTHVMIERGKKMTSLYTHAIISCMTLHQRVQLLENILIMAKTFHLNKNYFALFALMDSLSSAPIQKLRKTWKTLSKESIDSFNELSRLVNPQRNYMNYRIDLSKSKPPVIAKIDLDCQELSLIEENNSSFLDSAKTIIHFDKGRKLSNILRRIYILTHQQNEYSSSVMESIKPEMGDALRLWLKRSVPSDEELLALSADCEPVTESWQPDDNHSSTSGNDQIFHTPSE